MGLLGPGPGTQQALGLLGMQERENFPHKEGSRGATIFQAHCVSHAIRGPV